MFLGVAGTANRSHSFAVLSLLHVSLIYVVAFGCLERYLLLDVLLPRRACVTLHLGGLLRPVTPGDGERIN